MNTIEETQINEANESKKSNLKSFLYNENKKNKAQKIYNQYSKQSSLNHVNSLSYTEISNISTNYPLDVSTSNYNRTGSIVNKKKKKIVTFKANFKLVEKIFFDPKEPVVEIEDQKKNLTPINADEKETINALKENQAKENIEDKLNVNCTCFIY